MNTENLTPRKHKRYDENFKRSAVELWLQGGKSWSTRAFLDRNQADARLMPLIASAHCEGRREYGSPRVMRWLQQRGHPCGRRRISRLMQHFHFIC